MFYQLEKVNCEFGAPFGRTPMDNPDCTHAKIHLIPIIEGYDNGGAYWGEGDNLYAAVGEGFIQFKRAIDLEKAKDFFQNYFSHITFEMDRLGEFVKGYADAALFSTNDDDDNPLDDRFTVEDVHPDTLTIFEQDCQKFLEKAAPFIKFDEYENAGRFFWYTRNHHGVGYWDGEFGDDSMELQRIAEEFSEVYLFVENEKVCQE